MNKVIFTVNENKTAARVKAVKDDSQKVISDFIKTGKVYGNWNFLSFYPGDKDYKYGGTFNVTHGENHMYLIITNSKIQAAQIADNQPIEKFAIYWMLKLGVNEVFVFDISGGCPSYDIPKFNIGGSCYYCGPEATDVWVTSE